MSVRSRGVRRVQITKTEGAENRARLDACAGPHDFKRWADADDHAGRGLFRCGRCGGLVSERFAGVYLSGVKHGLAAAARAYRDAEARARARAR